MSNPHKPGTPEWQQWLNEEIARHDAENKARDARIDAENRRKAQEAADKAAEEERKRNENK